MRRRRARLSDAEVGDVARRSRGFCLVFVVNSSAAVAGECARASRTWAGCVGVVEGGWRFGVAVMFLVGREMRADLQDGRGTWPSFSS